jgi:hypothetical protein
MRQLWKGFVRQQAPPWRPLAGEDHVGRLRRFPGGGWARLRSDRMGARPMIVGKWRSGILLAAPSNQPTDEAAGFT